MLIISIAPIISLESSCAIINGINVSIFSLENTHLRNLPASSNFMTVYTDSSGHGVNASSTVAANTELEKIAKPRIARIHNLFSFMDQYLLF